MSDNENVRAVNWERGDENNDVCVENEQTNSFLTTLKTEEDEMKSNAPTILRRSPLSSVLRETAIITWHSDPVFHRKDEQLEYVPGSSGSGEEHTQSSTQVMNEYSTSSEKVPQMFHVNLL